MGIHRSSVSKIICKDLHLKCFKRRRAQELTDANCAVRMKRAKLLQVPAVCHWVCFLYGQKALLGHFTWQSAEQSSGRLQELLKKKLSVFFSAGTARSATAGRLLTVPVSRNFLNSLLTPCFVQLFSGNSSVNLFAVYPFKYKLFIKILSSSHILQWRICSDEFPMLQINCKSK